MIGLFVKDLYLFLFKSYFVLQSFCFYFFLRGRGVLKYYVFNLVAVRIMFVRGHLSEKIITHGNHYLHHNVSMHQWWAYISSIFGVRAKARVWPVTGMRWSEVACCCYQVNVIVDSPLIPPFILALLTHQWPRLDLIHIQGICLSSWTLPDSLSLKVYQITYKLGMIKLMEKGTCWLWT